MRKVLLAEVRAAMAVLWVSRHQWSVIGYLLFVLGFLTFTWVFPYWVYADLFVLVPITAAVIVVMGLGLWVCMRVPDPDHDIPDVWSNHG